MSTATAPNPLHQVIRRSTTPTPRPNRLRIRSRCANASS